MISPIMEYFCVIQRGIFLLCILFLPPLKPSEYSLKYGWSSLALV